MARRLLTPNEVRTATLHATWLRGGYDTDETDELLDDCAYTIQVLTEKLAEDVADIGWEYDRGRFTCPTCGKEQH